MSARFLLTLARGVLAFITRGLLAFIAFGTRGVLAFITRGLLAFNSIPSVPAGFDPTSPSAAALATPYGHLFELLTTESNPDAMGSAVALLDQAADLLRIPELQQ